MAELLSSLRGIDIGLTAVLLAFALALPPRASAVLWPLPLCLLAYLLRSAPWAVAAPVPVLLPLTSGALLFPVAFWWLLHNVFDDRADLPWPALLSAGVLLVAGLMPPTPGALLGPGAHVLQKLVAAGFVLAALWRMARSFGDDLVAGRRSLRAWLLGYVGAHGLVVLAIELWLGGRAAPAWMDALNLAAIGLAVAATLAFLLRPDAAAAQTLFGPAPSLPMPEPRADQAAQSAPIEELWLQRLEQLMKDEHAYRDPELSPGSLADRMGIPEYRLRELINRRLGYRNFPAFVNEHRLREVEQKLADPLLEGRPILTLALEAGFGSVGPFNRAFRERHGMTPSDYRGARRGAAPAG